jgi:HK97 family phage major capsid protein
MNLSDITNKINELASNWEHFKAINDRRLTEIEKKGSVDPLTQNHLQKLNDLIDNHQTSLQRIETALNRPFSEQKAEYNNINEKEHQKAFLSYIRNGSENELRQIEEKSTLTSDYNSGYLITKKMKTIIAESLIGLSPIRKLANAVDVSSDGLELIEDRMEAVAGWEIEADQQSNDIASSLTKKIIPVHDLYAQPKVTQKLIDDASIDIESWLANKLVDIFLSKENDAFINGDGINKPKGILSYASGKEWGKIERLHSGISGEITTEALIKLTFSLKESYAVNAKFLMSRDAIQAVRMLKDTASGKYLWQPSLQASTPDNLLGAEVVQSADMPIMQDGSLSIIYGDFKHGYQIVDRQDVRILRDPYTNKPFVKFYTTKRVGGDVINFDALKVLELSA